MSNKSVVFQSPHVCVISQVADTDTIFCTFNELGETVSGDRFWGDTFFEKLKVSSIGVMTTTPNWYPELDMIGAIKAIRAITHGRRVVTYGFSQGGYGALKYSRALDASAALAFSPEWTINPDDTKNFDRRWTNYYRPELRNGLRIEQSDVSANTYVFFDRRYKVDAWNAENILTLAGTKAIATPFCRHATVRLFSETGVGADLISLMMTDASDYSV